MQLFYRGRFSALRRPGPRPAETPARLSRAWRRGAPRSGAEGDYRVGGACSASSGVPLYGPGLPLLPGAAARLAWRLRCRGSVPMSAGPAGCSSASSSAQTPPAFRGRLSPACRRTYWGLSPAVRIPGSGLSVRRPPVQPEMSAGRGISCSVAPARRLSAGRGSEYWTTARSGRSLMRVMNVARKFRAFSTPSTARRKK